MVKDNNGVNYTFSPDEEDLLAFVAKMNIKLNQYMIFIKYKGFDEIHNSTYLHLRMNAPNQSGCDTYPLASELSTYAENNNDPDTQEPYYQDDCINIFLTDHMYREYCAPLVGLATMGGYLWYEYNTLNDGGPYREMALYHEFGHALGLLHTHHAWENTTGLAENVTRDLYDPCFNADIAGDHVIDTPAAFPFPPHDGNCNYLYDPEETVHCIPTNEYVPYEGILINNYMAYNTHNAFICQDSFTEGQGERIRFFVQEHLPEVIGTVESLYEPYKGVYFTVGNYGEYLLNPAKLQSGFDYEILECGDGSNELYESPTPYGQTFSYTSTIIHTQPSIDIYNGAKHPNHSAIRIVQLESQPHKCWNNWNKAASFGSVTKYNDGIINTNITTYPKDSMQINDSQLIQNLDNGLYQIDKNYNDGSQEQNLIIKNNE